MNNLRIGTCGFRINKEEYIGRLWTVEIQHTFYQPPQVKTLEKWREAVPADFEFTLKAWQLITHESSSPTFKRLRRKLTEKELAESGAFKSTEIVREAWQITRDCAKALKARTVLFQCPASFKSTRANIKNIEKFFTTIERDGLNLCWEPRGNWTDETIRELCSKLDLWHTVDPFSRTTVTPDKCYFRLHGRIRWRYEYDEAELEELLTLITPDRLAYVFFNNMSMTKDAETFQKLASIYQSGGRSEERNGAIEDETDELYKV